jgi:tetratricopeptide (TPR) repeat protein
MLRILSACMALLLCLPPAHAQEATVLAIENIVQTTPAGQAAWQPATPNQSLATGERIRTRQRSRATVRLTSLYTLRLDQFTTIEITQALTEAVSRPELDLQQGASFIFSREEGGEIGIRTPAANGALRGTQLVARVLPDGRSYFQVLEGTVEMTNPHGRLLLAAGEAGEAARGEPPRRTAKLEARNLLQWALYYPAVIDPAELSLPESARKALADSLAAYQSGDLLEALARLPARLPDDPDARVFTAGVLLSVGRVDEATAQLASVPRIHRGRIALERLIAAVKLHALPGRPPADIVTASEAVAESYLWQSQAHLEEARQAARHATALSPTHGFAWTRLAELEFSFGRPAPARRALDHALTRTPRDAQAHALRGFVLSAENRIRDAEQAFETAIDLDGALGNGWLGRGLVRIRQGHLADGRADLQTAATVEPATASFHSYLGKAWSMENDDARAHQELDLARLLDPKDPTPWLYSAIDHQARNRPNEAIADIEESIRLNDNRRVFRSSLLLDQDRAVRSANLAAMYQNAGMNAVAVREATRAVESDYTNASAHLFLANAFDALRDPRRISLRYETPWFNELLLANLLSPVGGGPLSQFVSQQEYSKLLEADGLGGALTTQWRGSSDFRSTASLFGTHGNISFGLDAAYFNDTGDRPNSEAYRAEIYAQFKWQVTPSDVFYFLGKWQDQSSGDNFETFSNQPLSPFFDFEENQEPGLLLAGWNHRWAPGSITLFLGGRLHAVQRLTDPSASQYLVLRDALGFRPGVVGTDAFGFDQFTDPAFQDPLRPPVTIGLDGEAVEYTPALLQALAPHLGSGQILGLGSAPFTFDTRREFEIYTAEVQHILQTRRNLALLGARWQEGEFDTRATLSVIRPTFAGGFTTPAADQHSIVDFQRQSAYAYDYLQVTPWLTLIGGVTWDHIEHPDNFRNPPVNDRQRDQEQTSGKAGFTLTPSPWITLRGAYTESLGGVTFDESVRLEPTQIAGFNQAYRTILSESIAGSVETPLYKTYGLTVEGRLPTRTWWAAGVTVIEQDVDRTLGAFDGYDFTLFPISPAYFPGGLDQSLAYQENIVTATVNQLVGNQFAVGAGYRATRSSLRTTLPEIPVDLTAAADTLDEATLHELLVHADWNSPHGWFARLEARWFKQDLHDSPRYTTPDGLPAEGDDFWQFNAFAGYRFNRNLCEISAGVLNIAGTDYALSPLNQHEELVRRPTLVLQCRLGF